ncbi:MAG: ribosomal protein S18-alanine N-acetyltransferase [Desulfobacterales bacterium]|nr:ribosomal protein S18-alanine N-acetyltransferase [Deltaproteobacteria bacterium]NNK97353.1 ribosomal protein S18-alanine N-acetyltransferase [Desulfobacterales bacterium]
MQIPWSETPAIRPLAYADIADLAEIEKEEPSAWSQDAIAAELLQTDGLQFVFSKSGITSGWLCCRISGCEAELLKVTVSKKCRHRGVATLLLSCLEQELTERGVGKLFLEVRSSNVSAIAFYFQVGFTEVGRRINYYRQPTDDALLFKKKL